MTVASPSPFLFAAALVASLGCAALAIAQQPAADVQLEIDLLEDRVDSFFRTLTDKSTGAERAIREIIGNSPLKDRNDDIKLLIDQSTSLDQRYGAYTGHEQASARNVGKDLIFLRYVYKGERFPVVWYFTFYRPGGNGMLKREWTLIGLRFDSKVEVLDRSVGTLDASERTMPAPSFRESNLFGAPIRDLGLSLADTRLAPIVREFEGELNKCGITRLKPRFHLSTEWGVPFQTIVIGIPFYLARPELTDLHREEVGHIEGFNRKDILRYLRHEMGHVVNYAYKLYDQEDWVEQFGSITQPYVEDYQPQPFSRRFVRHLPGWYAQKHPDEDWAETFAVWMTPKLDWRKDYSDWPTALAKLEYCDRTMARLNQTDPLVVAIELDEDVGDLTYSLQQYYKQQPTESMPPAAGLDGALRAMFDDLASFDEQAESRPAGPLIRKMERQLMAEVFRWTGHFPEKTRSLMRFLAQRADALQQVYPAKAEADAMLDITVLVTSLAMNHVHRGSYFPEPQVTAPSQPVAAPPATVPETTAPATEPAVTSPPAASPPPPSPPH